ncbi:MAG TPA: DUF167 domain-containing protein [candidate division Zixibacteria bacterium]|nr:DUF167 domain-containing protein [candidate division Zixibacteria bacterium]
MDFYDVITQTSNGIIVKLTVKPNSKKQDFIIDQGFLFVSVKSPPDKGKANKELIKYLSEIFNISSSNFELISGQTSRDKKLLVTGIEYTELKEKIVDYKSKK